MRTRSGRTLPESQGLPQRQQRFQNRQGRINRENTRGVQRNAQDDIKQIYSNVKSLPSFSSKIQEFFRTDETSSLHKRIRRKFRRRQTVAHYPYDLCMADLAFFTGPGMAQANNGNKYVLVFIDVFSKMCFVEPLKNKNA